MKLFLILLITLSSGLYLYFSSSTTPVVDDGDVDQDSYNLKRRKVMRNEDLHQGMARIIEKRKKREKPAAPAVKKYEMVDVPDEDLYPEYSPLITADDQSRIIENLQIEIAHDEQFLRQMEKQKTSVEHIEVMEVRIQKKKARLENLMFSGI